ncbi:MAG: Hpt domain-containing protein [Rhizobiales bacterium]|nr:Hpt domain-containing protein [Hyphomicrobiales bacterium]
MSTRSKRITPAAASRRTVTLDRAHLAHYTMENPDLEREIIALFLQQLPATTAMLKAAGNQADWKLAAHTLKGSAAAVGAARINALAVELEKCVFGAAPSVIKDLLAALDRAVTQFRKAAGRIYR